MSSACSWLLLAPVALGVDGRGQASQHAALERIWT